MKKGLLLLASCITTGLSAQSFTNVMISNANDPEEVSICIDPHNTNRLVAGSNIDNVYHSNDGGLTWTTATLSSPAYGVWGDPCISVDTAGNFYFYHLSNPPSGNWIDRMVCQKSSDGGATWTSGTYAGLNGTKAQDKEWVAVSPFDNTIYMTWTQFDVYGTSNPQDSSNILFSKSTDGGLTWAAPTRINHTAGDCIDSDNTVEGAVPCVGPNGEVYVGWNGPNGIVFQRSTDGGATWLANEISVAATPGGWDYNISGLQRCNGLPITVCDLSGGPNHGTIYINWSDQRNGSGDTDIWMSKSTDGGTTWSAPIRVNNDAPGKQQFMSWMTIDQATGYLYTVFYDRRNFTSGNQTDVFLAQSTDGGQTWSNTKINQSSFLPASNVFFGDYINITAHNNVVRPMWMQLSGASLSVWTALVDGTLLGIPTHSDVQAPVVLDAAPNPFNASTNISFELKKQESLTLTITDVNGRIVAQPFVNEAMDEGDHDYILNTDTLGLAPGVYFCTLTGEHFAQSHKLVVY